MPKISVVMPTYNAERYVAEAIDSILAQTLSDFELLIIDDCSTDKTKEIVRSYADERIKFIERNTINISAALNLGIALSKGKYIARMDADDVSLPTRLETQYKFMEENSDVGILGTNVEEIDEIKNCSRKRSVIEKPAVVDTLTSCVLIHPTVMFRKSFLEKYSLSYNEEFFVTEDQEFWSRAIIYGKIRNLPDVLLKYRIHKNSATHIKEKEGVEKLNHVRLNVLNWLTGGTYDCSALDRIYSIPNAFHSLNRSNPSVYFLGIPVMRVFHKIDQVELFLFSVLPLLKIKMKPKKHIWRLFFFIPILKEEITDKEIRFKLFYVLPVLKIKSF